MADDVTVTFGANADDLLSALDSISAGLQEQLALLATVTSAYQKTYDRALAAQQQFAAASAAAARQMAKNGQKGAQDQQKAFEAAVAPIGRAFDGMIDGLVRGTETWRQAATRAAESVLTSEIDADAKWLAHRLLTNVGIQSSESNTARGGMLAWLLSETQKTSATVAGAAQREAADSDSVLKMAWNWIANLLGITTAQTSANTQQVSQQTATAALLGSIAASSALGQISDAAGVAAANAYAATAAIPMVGPELAPGAAMEAYAATMAWAASVAGGPAFAAGAWNLPSDVAGASLHRGEMVVPENFASGIRRVLSGGDGPGGGAGLPSPAMNFTIQAMDGADVHRLLTSNHGAVAAALRTAWRNASPHLR